MPHTVSVRTRHSDTSSRPLRRETIHVDLFSQQPRAKHGRSYRQPASGARLHRAEPQPQRQPPRASGTAWPSEASCIMQRPRLDRRAFICAEPDAGRAAVAVTSRHHLHPARSRNRCTSHVCPICTLMRAYERHRPYAAPPAPLARLQASVSVRAGSACRGTGRRRQMPAPQSASQSAITRAPAAEPLASTPHLRQPPATPPPRGRGPYAVTGSKARGAASGPRWGRSPQWGSRWQSPLALLPAQPVSRSLPDRG